MVLTNDPSLTAWGYAVIDENHVVTRHGAIKTESMAKKLKIRKGDDMIRRLSEIIIELLTVMDENAVRLIVSELPHGSQNAAAARMIGAVTGLLQAIATVKGIPIEWYSECDAKKALTGRRSVAKNETIQHIKKHYNIVFAGVKWIDQAVADAMAVYHVARQQSQILKYLMS